MKIDYGSNKLKKQLAGATEIKKAFGINAVRVSRRLAEIEASESLRVLLQIPGANCHPLTGDMTGEWAVDISANHRMIFELDHNPVPLQEDGSIDTGKVTDVLITGTKDYH